MAFTSITVTGTFERANNQPATGTITATLTKPITNTGETVEPTPILGELNSEGKLRTQAGEPFTLIANDDTGTLPAGSEYEFVVQITGAPVRSFQAIVPHTAAEGEIDITELEG